MTFKNVGGDSINVLKIKRLSGGLFMSNCYIIYNDLSEFCAVVDPGVEPERILSSLPVNNGSPCKIKHIILTHSHIDHILYMDELRSLSKARVLIHSAEARFTSDRRMNGAAIFGIEKQNGAPDGTLSDGDILVLDKPDQQLEIIHTPGHSPGGICIKAAGFVLTGDTLFQMSIGRTDLGYGDAGELLNSIHNKLFALPDETVVYPGHGPETTIGKEKTGNPYVL